MKLNVSSILRDWLVFHLSTIKDIARETGLSLATISKYMNGGHVLDQNRERIEAAIQKLDYKVNYFARGLKTNRSMTIGVLLPTISSPFFGRVVAAMDAQLRTRGYHCVTCSYNFDPELELEQLRLLVGINVDGIVFVPQQIDGEAMRSIIEHVPMILIDRVIPNFSCDAVIADSLNAIYGALEALFRKQHRRVGLIVGPQDISTARERLIGYRRVHEDYRIPVDEQLIQIGNYDLESGYRLFNVLMDLPEPPTAVCVTNYDMTVGAITAAHERGIALPEQVDFIGFDNIDLCRVVTPPLPIVEQPMEEMGREAAQLLLRRLDGSKEPPQMLRLKSKISQL